MADILQFNPINQFLFQEQEAIDYLNSIEFFNNNICYECGQEMREFYYYSNGIQQYKNSAFFYHIIQQIGGNLGRYKCYRCNRYRSKLTNTILENSKMSIAMFLSILYYFSIGISTQQCIRLLKNVNNAADRQQSIIRLYKLFRKIIHNDIQQNLLNTTLRGRIEIDESLIYKTKYNNRGRRYAIQYWIFGMREREGQTILIPVKNRTRRKLIQLIRQYVTPSRNTIIYSDCWSGYFNNRVQPRQSYLRRYGYRHIGINHSVRFVNRINNSIHTNTIEREWREVKKMLKRYNPKKDFKYYVSQYMWENQCPIENRFYTLIDLIMDIQNQ